MRLNADIIYHNLKDTLDVTIYGMCETELALYRPEFYLDRNSRFLENHVYVCSADHLPEDPVIEGNVLLICLGEAPQREKFEQRCGILSVSGREDIFRVFNTVQGIFNKYETWETELSRILRRSASLQELLEASRGIFNNPMLLIGSDFSYLAYTEHDYLQDRMGIRLDGSAFDPDLLDAFLSLHELATDIKEPLLLSLMGRSTLSVNLFDVDDFLGCITVFGEYRDFRSSDIQLCRFLAENIRQAFLLKPHLAGDRSSLRLSLLHIISGQPLSQEQRNVITRHGDHGELVCVAFRPAADSHPLPSGYVSSLIEEQFKDSLAFEYDSGIAAVIPAEQCVEQQLASLLQKLRLICGVSHPFPNLHESAYAYYQASSVLDTGTGIAPGGSIYRFEDYILPLLLRNATADIPARYFYIEGLSRLAAHDACAPVSYLDTLKNYLDSSMSIAETARKMNLHRSSLIDRLNRITQILDCDLTDPNQRLAIQIVLSAEQAESREAARSRLYTKQ
jgi:hypothetical protein